MHPEFPCRRGMLVSIEGVTGVGKTHLTTQLRATSPGPVADAVVVDEFSSRPAHGDLGHDLLRALTSAARGDPFLRGGYPATETLLLLAIKTYDYEARCAAAMRDGRHVLEGRSLHCVAVYQSLILHPTDDQRAYDQMRAILGIAAQWRPLPDLTFLITDDVNAAVERAERRDGITFSPADRLFHHRVAALFDRLAAEPPGMVTVIDRRHLGSADAITLMRSRIDERHHTLPCVEGSWPSSPANSPPCRSTCRLAPRPSTQPQPASAPRSP